MQNYNIDLTVGRLTLSRDELLNILCAAIGSGCSFWACIGNDDERYQSIKQQIIKSGDECPTMEDIIMSLWDNNMPLVVYEDEDDDGTFSAYHEVRLCNFLEAIKLAYEDGYIDNDDIYDTDGEAGDTILQYAVFNEIIYG